MAIPLRPEEVPKDLICAICLSVPLEPVIVNKCAHVFCENCIAESFLHQQCNAQDESCPICRVDCSLDDLLLLEDESPLAYRIWSSIAVKCEHHAEGCEWNGSILDYRSHTCSCQQTIQQSDRDKEIISSLKKENQDLKVKNKILDIKNQELEVRYRHQNFSTVNKELENLRAIVLTSIEMPVSNGRGGYAYNCTNVVQLTKLICQNLENRPAKINSNKIFECVKKIGSDLRQEYSNEPEHFFIDSRMLMGVCLASTWFTENQLTRIREISAEYGWV